MGMERRAEEPRTPTDAFGGERGEKLDTEGSGNCGSFPTGS
jgi:hypothetical protein